MIGLFDSGVGGLTILRGLIKQEPNYNYFYLGDNANVPYGNKSKEAIYSYSVKAIDFLYKKGCKIIIIACNSASSQALRRIQQEYLPDKYPDLKVLGVIRPIAEEVAKHPEAKKIGVIGTKATINSNSYLEEIKKVRDNVEVFQKPTPLLVPLIEESWGRRPETKMILKKYLRSLKMNKVDILITACTHYPFLLGDIRRIMGKNCLVFDTEKIVADSFFKYIDNHKELNIERSDKPKYHFFTTDKFDDFISLGEKFLGKKIDNIEQVSL
jgi:glutamate racemase